MNTAKPWHSDYGLLCGEPFHLFRYLDEQPFRFNLREGNDASRFIRAVKGIVGRRLTYAKLIGETPAV
jgi:hypothetical protein